MNFLGLDSRQWIDIGISAIVLVVVPTLGRKIVNKWLIRLIQTILVAPKLNLMTHYFQLPEHHSIGL
ncbi:MAG: hypothetical protein CM1200mP6_07720 [Anaerolineaceae bacterium]|nr:MAG: hypothetical protein CM1200mP6_07720 [Anaerolineaceae bacterium]